MKIGLFTDSHYCNKDSTEGGIRRPLLSYDKIKIAMSALKDTDLVICLGDLVDDCDNIEDNTQYIKKITDLIKSYNIPFYSLMGNHDYQNFTKEEFNSYTNGSYPPYSMSFGSNKLVFLDPNHYADGSVYGRGNAKWDDANVPKEQIDKLKEILDDEKVENVYLFLHQNLDPDVESHHIVKNAQAIRELLVKSGKVRKVIQGHYHEGHDNVVDGILYHTLKAMCDGEENYYEIMEI